MTRVRGNSAGASGARKTRRGSARWGSEGGARREEGLVTEASGRLGGMANTSSSNGLEETGQEGVGGGGAPIRGSGIEAQGQTSPSPVPGYLS